MKCFHRNKYLKKGTQSLFIYLKIVKFELQITVSKITHLFYNNGCQVLKLAEG